MKSPEQPEQAEALACPSCHKHPPLCFCAEARPLPTRVKVLILQHPQESDKTLGSGRLAHSLLADSRMRVGLSWPNLTRALGEPGENARWGVLYLGSHRHKGPRHQDREPGAPAARLWIVDRKGGMLPAGGAGLDGIVVLDGSWSQAKTMWWRNPWLLKLRRLVLEPIARSEYRELRRQPRRECMATIESIAGALEALGEDTETPRMLRQTFAELLRRYRASGGARRDRARDRA